MNVLVSLPLLRLDTVLIRPLPLDQVRLLVLIQEARLGWVIREESKVPKGDEEGAHGQDDHEPLPLVWVMRRVGMRDSEGEEAGDDGCESIALERPAYALGGFNTGVKHGHDGHDAAGNTSF